MHLFLKKIVFTYYTHIFMYTDHVSIEDLFNTVDSMKGEISQIPPMYIYTYAHI